MPLPREAHFALVACSVLVSWFFQSSRFRVQSPQFPLITPSLGLRHTFPFVLRATPLFCDYPFTSDWYPVALWRIHSCNCHVTEMTSFPAPSNRTPSPYRVLIIALHETPCVIPKPDRSLPSDTYVFRPPNLITRNLIKHCAFALP